MLGKNLISAASGNAGGEVLGIEDVFSTWLYTGNGSTQTITNGIDLSGEGGLTWIKIRDTTGSHFLFDTSRGATKDLRSNSTSAEGTLSGGLTAFNSTGFSLGSDNAVNGNTNTYASWTFRKAPKFFDVVTYTGDGVQGRNIAHTLGSAPGCIIIKCTSSAYGWIVYHRSTGADEYLILSSTVTSTVDTARWNNTEPTSSVFTVGNAISVNESGQTYVAYLFAHDAGGFGDDGTESVIKCGLFNDTTAGSVDLGWEPQFVLYKANINDNWKIVDNMRGFPASGSATVLYPNSSSAESGATAITINSTGFSYPAVYYTGHVYIAIRRGPMKTPEDATTVFDVDAVTGTGSSLAITTGFPVDLGISKDRSSNDWYWVDRVRGKDRYLSSNTAGVEVTASANPTEFDNNTGVIDKNYGSTTSNYVSFNLRRAPGFFDVVAYTGTALPHTIPHNLGVTPELIIGKLRNTYTRAFFVDYMPLGLEGLLDSTAALYSGALFTSANSTEIYTPYGSDFVNGSGLNYIAYLFATCPGVSKVGSFTGDGNPSQNIECGFTSGARFVLVKGTAGTTDWLVWDTARGIVSGNDPLLKPNSTAAEETNTDDIDPYSGGFAVTNAGNYGLNASGQNFIFLAIA